MATRNGSVLIKAVAGILTLGAAGAGALHFTGTCPLGSCYSGDKTAARDGSVTVLASTSAADTACERACAEKNEATFRPTATEAAFFEIDADALTSCDEADIGCDEAKLTACDGLKECEQDETIVADNTTGK